MIELTQAMAAWPTVVDRQQVVALWRQYRRQQDPNGLLINVDVTSDHDTLTESVLISVGNTHSLAQEDITCVERGVPWSSLALRATWFRPHNLYAQVAGHIC